MKFLLINNIKLSIGLILFFSDMTFAQNFIVGGRVTGEINNEGIPNVNIMSNDSIGAVTDSDGFYHLSFESNMPRTLTFRSFGFQAKKKKIEWMEKSNITLHVKLEGMIFPLEQIVVTSSRYKQELNEVSVSMELLKPSLIENTNSNTLDKALEKIPGVNVIDGQINIRGGSGYSYGAGSRVMLLVDDLPMLSADANDVKWKFIPVEMTEQVEIIKGASSAIYGSSALGGVVNLRTKYARNSPETVLRYFHGVYGKPRNKEHIWKDNLSYFNGYSVFHSQKVKRLDISLCAATFNDEGYRQGEYNSNIRLNANLRYRTNVNGLSFGANLSKMNDNGGLFFYWLSEKKPFVPATNTASIYNNYRSTFDPFITYTGKHGNNHSFKSRIYNTTNSNNTNQGSMATGYYSEYVYRKIFEYSQNANLNISSGLVFSRTYINSDSLYGTHEGYNEGIFLQADPNVSIFHVSAGVRIESYKVDATNRLYSPVFRSGISVNGWKGGFVRASAGQGFRYPSVAELFTETRAGSVQIFPNPLLKPEKGLSYEAGIRQGFRKNNFQGYFDLTVFSTEYKNLMEYSFGMYNAPSGTLPFLANYIKYGGFQSKNVTNRARVQGFEANLFFEKTSGDFNFQVLAGHTWLDPIDLDHKREINDTLGDGFDNMLKYRFRNISKANLNFHYKKTEFGGEFRYNSFMQNIDDIFNVIIPGVYNYRMSNNSGDYLLDVHFSFWLSEQWKMNFICKNLLNREYMFIPGGMNAPVSFVVQAELKI